MSAARTQHVSLGCKQVVVPTDGVGHVDAITRTPGLLKISGWAFDPDADGGPQTVQVSLDTGAASRRTTTGLRPDVQSYFGLANDSVGYAMSVGIPAGHHVACLYSLNTAGTGHNGQLTCVSVSG